MQGTTNSTSNACGTRGHMTRYDPLTHQCSMLPVGHLSVESSSASASVCWTLDVIGCRQMLLAVVGCGWMSSGIGVCQCKSLPPGISSRCGWSNTWRARWEGTPCAARARQGCHRRAPSLCNCHAQSPSPACEACEVCAAVTPRGSTGRPTTGSSPEGGRAARTGSLACPRPCPTRRHAAGPMVLAHARQRCDSPPLAIRGPQHPHTLLGIEITCPHDKAQLGTTGAGQLVRNQKGVAHATYTHSTHTHTRSSLMTPRNSKRRTPLPNTFRGRGSVKFSRKWLAGCPSPWDACTADQHTGSLQPMPRPTRS